MANKTSQIWKGKFFLSIIKDLDKNKVSMKVKENYCKTGERK